MPICAGRSTVCMFRGLFSSGSSQTWSFTRQGRNSEARSTGPRAAIGFPVKRVRLQTAGVYEHETEDAVGHRRRHGTIPTMGSATKTRALA